MPFASKAQRRKFYAMKSRGEMSQKKINEWESHTKKSIPERVRQKKAAYLNRAYAHGCYLALLKLGMDADSFEAFAQEDDTPEAAPAHQDADPPDERDINEEMLKLMNPPSPWNGAELLDTSNAADI